MAGNEHDGVVSESYSGAKFRHQTNSPIVFVRNEDGTFGLMIRSAEDVDQVHTPEFSDFLAWSESCRHKFPDYYYPENAWPHLETEGTGEDLVYVFRLGVREGVAFEDHKVFVITDFEAKAILKFTVEDDGKSIRIPYRKLKPHWDYLRYAIFIEGEYLLGEVSDLVRE